MLHTYQLISFVWQCYKENTIAVLILWIVKLKHSILLTFLVTMTNYLISNLRDGGFVMVGKHGDGRSPKVFLLTSLGTRKQREGRKWSQAIKRVTFPPARSHLPKVL